MLKISWRSKGAPVKSWCKAQKNSAIYIMYIELKWINTVQKTLQKQRSNFIYVLDVCNFKINQKELTFATLFTFQPALEGAMEMLLVFFLIF